jgi:hypothetical protein
VDAHGVAVVHLEFRRYALFVDEHGEANAADRRVVRVVVGYAK